jgi:hypothetical protein
MVLVYHVHWAAGTASPVECVVLVSGAAGTVSLEGVVLVSRAAGTLYPLEGVVLVARAAGTVSLEGVVLVARAAGIVADLGGDNHEVVVLDILFPMA